MYTRASEKMASVYLVTLLSKASINEIMKNIVNLIVILLDMEIL